MQARQKSPGVYEVDGEHVCVGRGLIHELQSVVMQTPRKRARICAHRSADDQVHEMLIALAATSYVRPHKHLDKSESYHLIFGRADLVLFEDDGRLKERIELGDFASGASFFARVTSPVYHCIVVWSDLVVFHETTNGPFDRRQTVEAPWAPIEDDTLAAARYQAELRAELNQLASHRDESGSVPRNIR